MHDHAADAVLRAYLSASTEGEADRQLERIVEAVALPAARRVVASVYRDFGSTADREDVVADAIADVLRRLRELRGDRSQAIHDFRRYVVSCAYNRCHERLRERYPARNRLRNQLQYLCGHDARLGLWRTASGTMVCGLGEWLGREPVTAEGIDLPACSDPAAENRAQIAKLVLAVFRQTAGPLDLDTLVATIARLIDLEVQRVDVPLASLAQDEPAADSVLELRASLRELWNDVGRLAPKQRAALLLNLAEVHLLPLTRTATIAEIAAAVEMPPERFAALWNDLPLTDAAIAELLGMTPRQVIKVRRLARERLRRMEKRHAVGGELRVCTR